MTPDTSPALPSLFDFHGSNIRTVNGSDGELWFIAADACGVLGLKNVAQAVVGNEKSGALGVDAADRAQIDLYVRSASGVSQRRSFWIVNESGLYRLIFASKKPAAEAFQHWVTHEVLPSIRKTGNYSMPGQAVPQQTYVEQLQSLISRLEAQERLASPTPADFNETKPSDSTP